MRHVLQRSVAVCLIAVICTNVAHAGLITGFYNFGHSNTLTNVVESDDFGGIVSQTVFTTGTFGDSGYAYARASTGSLGVLVDTYDSIGAYAELSGLVQFNSADPLLTHADVIFRVTVQGFFNITGSGAGVGSSLRLHNQSHEVSEQAYDSGRPVFRNVIYEHELPAVSIPLGVPVGFAATLRTGFYDGVYYHGIADFSNSLTFNPDAFFQINTPGVTVNSVGGDWLVDNRLASAATVVPEPSSLALLGTGALALVGFGRRSRRRAAE